VIDLSKEIPSLADSMTTASAEKAETKRSAKDEVRALLDRLPDDVTLEKIQYHLDVMVKVL
jgi:hypothetical protein